jgi:hypothetical protein
MPKKNCNIVTKSFSYETIGHAAENEKYTLILNLQYLSDS